MSTALVDPEGFPRSDIDVAGVRMARQQMNRLKNDLTAVVDEMALLLQRGLPVTTVTNSTSDSNGATQEQEPESATTTAPFARVDQVANNSPAQLAVSLSHSSIYRNVTRLMNVWK